MREMVTLGKISWRSRDYMFVAPPVTACRTPVTARVVTRGAAHVPGPRWCLVRVACVLLLVRNEARRRFRRHCCCIQVGTPYTVEVDRFMREG